LQNQLGVSFQDVLDVL